MYNIKYVRKLHNKIKNLVSNVFKELFTIPIQFLKKLMTKTESQGNFHIHHHYQVKLLITHYSQ